MTVTACGASTKLSEPVRTRGLIDLNARMPVGDSPYGIAYGTATGSRAFATPNIDEYLKPEYRAPSRTSIRVASAKRDMPAAAVAANTTSPRVSARVPQVIAQEPAPMLAHANPPPATPPSGTDAPRYAERDQNSQAVEQFRGGDAIVITSGAILLILLIVILVLLLT